MGTLLFVLFTYVALHVGLYKVFEKAGEQGWKALVPFYSEAIWCKIIGRPMWWSVWLWVPLVGFFIGVGMIVDLARSFGRHSFAQHFFAVVLPFVYFPLLGWKDQDAYQGPAWEKMNNWRKEYKKALAEGDALGKERLEQSMPFPKKTIVREWTESILFAVFAAHFIRLFAIEAYTIPTPSMEGSLLVGDFLFVSKLHYGSRLPMTPLSFPLLHNTLPFTGGECYTTALQWGYNRAPALQSVERYDPVVFNFPEDDTVFGGLDVPFEKQYHNLIKSREATREQILNNPALRKRLVVRPVDKRSFYIKRCVGLPGDKIQVKNAILYVNDAPMPKVGQVQYRHRVFTNKELSSREIADMESKHPITFTRNQNGIIIPNFADLSPEAIEAIKREYPQIDSFQMYAADPSMLDHSTYPYNSKKYPWNNDNYGPIVVPKKGTSVELSMDNIELYARIIAAYEGNDFKIDNGQFFINGKVATSYTFKMDYYWMMGDNRHNSADSRSWGFVPEDHIVGKPLFIWMSLKGAALANGIRWNRLFMSATGK
jgi:signal peptidase I